MSSRHCLGSLSSPPYPTPSLFLEIEGPPPEALLAPLTHPQTHQQQLPQQVLVDEAPEDLDGTFEYVFQGDDPEIASNAIVLVDATTQWSRPSPFFAPGIRSRISCASRYRHSHLRDR